MKTLASELKEIQSKLEPLVYLRTSLDKQISELFQAKKAVLNSIDLAYSKEIPEDLEKISVEQWNWILSAGHNETETQYKYQDKILQEFGFFRQGFIEETSQVSVCIAGKGIDKKIKGFNYLKKYLKPISNNYKNGNIQNDGIRFEVYNEDDFSVIYVDENEKISYYPSQSRYSNVRKFENFETFIKWHAEQMKLKEEENDDVDVDTDNDDY